MLAYGDPVQDINRVGNAFIYASKSPKNRWRPKF